MYHHSVVSGKQGGICWWGCVNVSVNMDASQCVLIALRQLSNNVCAFAAAHVTSHAVDLL